MKKLIKIFSLILAFCLIFCACNSKKSDNTKNATVSVKRPIIEYKRPANIMTEQQYIERIEELCAGQNFIEADETYLKKVDELGDDLKNMIVYNEDEVTVPGTKYYVANNGDDNNDGLSPDTAWRTLEKVYVADLKEGDAVLFNRGDFFRGQLMPHNGVTYSAYGKGFKPIIANSIDGLKDAQWVETDIPNVWKFNTTITNNDIGLILFNMGEKYAEKKMNMSQLKTNFDFCHNNMNVASKFDNYIYMYCDKGNPADLFWSIELSNQSSNVEIRTGQHDIKLHNLSLYFGGDVFFGDKYKNITMEYCTANWIGGYYSKSLGDCRLGGGAGVWLGCDTVKFEHCYFYQQFDSGVTPQYNMTDNEPVIDKNFETKSCLFEYCEYTYEYFMKHTNSPGGDKFLNNYFGYNFCRFGGQGFGDKATQSAYVKSWSSPNPTENCVIEKNIFDRAYTKILDMGARNSKDEFDITKMPKMNNNVYIAQKNRVAIRLNEKSYKFNEKSYQILKDLGFEDNAVYVFYEAK